MLQDICRGCACVAQEEEPEEDRRAGRRAKTSFSLHHTHTRRHFQTTACSLHIPAERQSTSIIIIISIKQF